MISFVIIIPFLILFFYFKFMRTNRWIETNNLYMLKNLLKKNSFFHIIYFKKKCDVNHPHLIGYAVSFFVTLILYFVLLIAFIMSLTLLKDDIISYCIIILGGSIILNMFLTLIINHLLAKYDEKKMNDMSTIELEEIQIKIISEYPDFFNNIGG